MPMRSPKALPLRLRILSLLAIHDSEGLNGYTLGVMLQVSNGSLYPALARVVAAAEVRVETDPSPHNGQQTKRYLLTEAGRAAVKKALAPPKPPPGGHRVPAATRTPALARPRRRAGPLPGMP